MFDFEAFFMCHYKRLYGMLYQMLGNSQEAEDIAQEAFLRFHKHFSSIYPEKRKAWLFRVAVNLGYTTLQTRKRHRNWSQRQVLLAQDAERTPSTVSRMDVREALDTLPVRQAKLLYLYASGLSYEEMAEALGVKVSSISQLLLRAKRAFKQTYGPAQ